MRGLQAVGSAIGLIVKFKLAAEEVRHDEVLIRALMMPMTNLKLQFRHGRKA
jgi:hypothetical protein